jgi:hypothetical protein
MHPLNHLFYFILFVPHRKLIPSPLRSKINQLMLCSEMVVVCFENNMKHKYTLWAGCWVLACVGWPPQWSSGQSSWLQIQTSEFDFRRYQIFSEVGLERGPFSLVSPIEKLLGRKSRGFGLGNREYGRRDPSHWQRGTLYPQKLVLTSPTSGCLWNGIVRSRTQAMEYIVEHI